jgi:hypothetical protein
MKLNRDQIIDRAVKWIKPPASRLAECRQDVAAALDEYDWDLREYRWEHLLESKEKRKRIEAVRVAAHRLSIAIENVPDEARRLFPMKFIEKIRLVKNVLEIKTPTERASARGGTRRDSYDKESAATAAFFLLLKYDREITTTKNSSWCMLAAALYGVPDADLQHACRAVARSILSSANQRIK